MLNLISRTYTSHYCRIIFLAIIDGDRLVVRASTEDAAVIVDSGCYKLLSVGCIC